MADRKTIRLRSPIRSGNQIVDNNAVVDATTEIAERLVADGHAEYTDAVERHPSTPFLDVLDDYPVTGAEKFPRPAGIEPVFAPSAFGTEADKRAELEGKATVGPAWDHPLKVGDESSPAKAPAEAPASPAKPAPHAPAAVTGTGSASVAPAK